MDFLPDHLIQVLPHQISWGREVKAFDDFDDAGQGWVVQDLRKPDDVILEHSLRRCCWLVGPLVDPWSVRLSVADYKNEQNWHDKTI